MEINPTAFKTNDPFRKKWVTEKSKKEIPQNTNQLLSRAELDSHSGHPDCAESRSRANSMQK